MRSMTVGVAAMNGSVLPPARLKGCPSIVALVPPQVW